MFLKSSGFRGNYSQVNTFVFRSCQFSTDVKKKKMGLKDLVTEYGVPFLIYWTGVWACTGVSTYVLLEATQIDSIALMAKIGVNLDISASTGNIATAVAINEMMEVVRLPFCIATFKPMHRYYKAKMAERKSATKKFGKPSKAPIVPATITSAPPIACFLAMTDESRPIR